MGLVRLDCSLLAIAKDNRQQRFGGVTAKPVSYPATVGAPDVLIVCDPSPAIRYL